MTFKRTAAETLQAVEMDRGDLLHFTCANGQELQIRIRRTSARVLSTTLEQLKEEVRGGKTALEFSAELLINGQPLTIVRQVSTQGSFYEPVTVAGVRIWLDAVDDLFEFLNETHGACRPHKQVRLAIQDQTLRICPIPLLPWCPLPEEGLDIRECYNADDCWMGAYFGSSAHGGLDINHPRGTPIWAPIPIDDHFLFDRVPEQNNNRWRGWHDWPDGSRWILQTHHLVGLLVPEHQPIPAGMHYAAGAGVWVGDHDHSHFVFKVQRKDEPEILLDPWILFWQMYRDHAQPDRFYSRSTTGLHHGHYTDARTKRWTDATGFA